MNILLIAGTDPRCTDFGSAQRTNLLWKALGESGQVTTLVLDGDVGDDAADSRIYAAPICRRSPILQFACNAWMHFLHFPFLGAPSRRAVRAALSGLPGNVGNFDVAVVRYLGNAVEFPIWRVLPTYVDMDDLPSETYQTIFAQGAGLASRIKLALCRAWERHYMKRLSGAWVANAAHVPYVGEATRCLALENIPRAPGAGYDIRATERAYILSVGAMDYAPNAQGVDWFLEHCWPGLRARFPHLEYRIAGRTPDAARARWARRPNVRPLGFVDDIDAQYQSAYALVAPIFSGSGTCIKVMECALHGRPVVGSPFAARGLSETEMHELSIVCRAEPSDFLEAVALRVQSPLSAEDAARAASYAAKRFSAERFQSAIQEMLAHG